MFDVEAARKAGYTDAEIAGYLATQNTFDAKAAKKAGYSDSEVISYLSNKKSAASQIPVEPGANTKPDGEKPTSVVDKIVGFGEAALSTVTGMTGGSAGMVAGALGGVAGAVASGEFGTPQGAQAVEQAAAQGAQALTYAPRTQSGQAQAQAIGEWMQQIIPVAPVIAGIARPVGAGTAASVAAANAKATVRQRYEAAQARRAAEQPNTPTPGTMGSMGAAGTDIATVRRMAAEDLPVPINLTKGQAERTFEQQRFERETAKDPERGLPLRERFADQNEAMLKNFDVWIDETGAALADPVSVGVNVAEALKARAAADKARIRVAYKNAEKAGEMEAPVVLSDVVNYINENAPDAAVAPVLDAAKARAVRLGIATLSPEGELIPQASPLKNAELFRRSISNATNAEPTNIRHAAQMKELIDGATDGIGGTLYKEARDLRSRYAQNYENIGLVYDLMNKKRGTSDNLIAAEDVFRKTILDAPVQDVRQVRRILQTGGEAGQQAFNELRGATVRYLRDEATKNVARDVRGNEIVSAARLHQAISNLDRAGKLDLIFGKKGAEQLRALNEIAKDVYTAPPGAVNTSNTASVLLAALDMAISGAGGLPLPVMSGLRLAAKNIKDRRVQKQVNEALDIVKEPTAKKPVQAPARTPQRTIH